MGSIDTSAQTSDKTSAVISRRSLCRRVGYLPVGQFNEENPGHKHTVQVTPVGASRNASTEHLKMPSCGAQNHVLSLARQKAKISYVHALWKKKV